MENIKETLESIGKARDIIESKGESCPVYIGFEKETYTLTNSEMLLVLKALSMADSVLFNNEEL